MAQVASPPFAEQFEPASVVVVEGARVRGRNVLTRRSGAPFEIPPIEATIEPGGSEPSAGDAGTDGAPAPTYSEDELAVAVAEARRDAAAEADAAARAELQASIESRQAAALEEIARALARCKATYDTCVEAEARVAHDLGTAFGRAVVPRALARAPLADVEAMLADLVPRLHEQPRLELRLPPDLVEGGRTALARLAEQAGYAGEVEVKADPSLADGDARLHWRHGAAERDLARLEAEAQAVVDAWMPVEDDGVEAVPNPPRSDDGAGDRAGPREE